MNVYDFCGLCIDEFTKVRIYDANACRELAPFGIVFDGTMKGASFSDYAPYTVWSFDVDDEGITLNVDTSDKDKE